MTVLVDASVAVKWVLQEPDSERARDLIGTDDMIAPDFLLLEAAHVLGKQHRRRALAEDDAVAGLQTIEGTIARLLPSMGAVAVAQRLAMTLNASVYDSLYLVIALAEGVTLVTADARFARAAASAHPGAVRVL